MSLLKEHAQKRLRRREELRLKVRQHLKDALHQLAPGEPVFVFGSITQPYKFHNRSDVDIALLHEPKQCSIYQLLSNLEEVLRRPVDVVLLGETRLREKIKREGELWTN